MSHYPHDFCWNQYNRLLRQPFFSQKNDLIKQWIFNYGINCKLKKELGVEMISFHLISMELIRDFYGQMLYITHARSMTASK